MNRELITFINENAKYLLIQLIDEHDAATLENEYQAIRKSVSVPFSLVAVKVRNWNDELSPWEAPAVFGKEAFGGGAPATFKELTDELLPALQKDYDFGETVKIIIGGYSLAALFALWCGYQSTSFYGIAAASPSVWFNGWLDYAAQHPFLAAKVYLSLGNKEEKTRNPIMATVGDCIRRQEQLFLQKGIPCTLEWNEGNHFREAEIRTAKAFVNLMQ